MRYPRIGLLVFGGYGHPMDGFRTSDIYFAAYLKVAGAKMVGTLREGRKVVFVLEDHGPIAMRQLKNAYFADSAKVHVLSFVQAVKHMKRLTVSGPMNEG